MNFSSIRIVLVATSHPGNIGSTARAIKTMGMDRLYLVTPKSFPDLKANEMAAGADDVLEKCQVVETLPEALKGCQLVIATSARPRGLSLPGLTPPACAELVCSQSDATEVAIVFGREHSGLTNDELLQCHFHVNIPSNPEYSSLNLAQAVQIIAYELRMRLLSPKAIVASSEEPMATVEDIERFYTHLAEVMLSINFLKLKNPGKMLARVRRLFTRVRLEEMEVAILRGFLSHIQKALASNKARKES
jgi:tRNA (cytidine32/uridine32-2'-O)-methyltransferase